MRRLVSHLSLPALLVAGGAVTLAGCGGGAISPEKARTQAVVEAAGGQLTGEVLDRWLVAQKTAPTKAEASGIVSAWINDALLFDAVRRNVVLDDPATFDSVVMETAARTVVAQYFAARDSQMPAITERQVDSLLDIDQARVFQQIVIRLKVRPDSASVAALKARANLVYQKVVKGGDFTAAVKEFSDDSASKATNGFLPALSAAEMGERLMPIYNLAPNAISPVISSPTQPAFLILRRATRQESRAGVKKWLAPRLARRADSIFVDSVAREKQIVIPADARIRTRLLAHEPVTAVDAQPLATWKGGALTPGAVRNATLTLAPVDRAGLTDASDTVVSQYLIGLARRDILLPIVSKEPLPTAAIRTGFLPAYKRVLDSLRAAIARLPAAPSAAEAATHHVDSVLVEHSPFFPLPGGLAGVLRARGNVKVNQQVLDAVVRGAVPRWQIQHKDDSSAVKGRPGPAIQPAPGGAPKPN